MGSGLVFCFRGSQILTLDVLVMYVANHKKENAQSQKSRPNPHCYSIDHNLHLKSKKQDLTPIVAFIKR